MESRGSPVPPGGGKGHCRTFHMIYFYSLFFFFFFYTPSPISFPSLPPSLLPLQTDAAAVLNLLNLLTVVEDTKEYVRQGKLVPIVTSFLLSGSPTAAANAAGLLALIITNVGVRQKLIKVRVEGRGPSYYKAGGGGGLNRQRGCSRWSSPTRVCGRSGSR